MLIIVQLFVVFCIQTISYLVYKPDEIRVETNGIIEHTCLTARSTVVEFPVVFQD